MQTVAQSAFLQPPAYLGGPSRLQRRQGTTKLYKHHLLQIMQVVDLCFLNVPCNIISEILNLLYTAYHRLVE